MLSLRVGAMLAFTPVFSLFPIPATARVLLVVALSVAIAGALRTPTMLAPDTGTFLALAATEFSFGLLLACGIFCAFAAVAFAARVLDIQIGFGIGQIFDPVSRAQVPVVTSVFMYSGALIFFLVDGHHALLRGLAHTWTWCRWADSRSTP
ncbi:flagellar biosynthetic protein FliR [Achromobacter xylosoxidans]